MRCLWGLRCVVRTWLWPCKQRSWACSTWAPWDSGRSCRDSARVRRAAIPGKLVGFVWGSRAYLVPVTAPAAAAQPRPQPFSPVAIVGGRTPSEAVFLPGASLWGFAFSSRSAFIFTSHMLLKLMREDSVHLLVRVAAHIRLYLTKELLSLRLNPLMWIII